MMILSLFSPSSVTLFVSSFVFVYFIKIRYTSVRSVTSSCSSVARKYRYVALDLDGTTLNNNHQLSQNTISTIKKLSTKGLKFLIATGRTSASIHSIAQLLDLPQQILPSVCFNGACGVEISSQYGILSTIFESLVSMESAEKLLAFAKERGLCAQYYISETGAVYASPQTDVHRILLERYAVLTGKKQHYVSHYDYPKSISPPAKILLLVGENHADDLMREAEALFGGEFHIVRGSPSPFFIEFLAPGTNKGSGLRRLCDHLKIPLDAVVSFGDGENDEEFLRYAGLGIAMKNARPLAKSAANLVLEWTNEEDGVARQLQRMDTEGSFCFDLEPQGQC
jgi:5-amino-6-(5-phospho-D-ribitylamino)uracil phosphatase